MNPCQISISTSVSGPICVNKRQARAARSLATAHTVERMNRHVVTISYPTGGISDEYPDVCSQSALTLIPTRLAVHKVELASSFTLTIITIRLPHTISQWLCFSVAKSRSSQPTGSGSQAGTRFTWQTTVNYLPLVMRFPKI